MLSITGSAAYVHPGAPNAHPAGHPAPSPRPVREQWQHQAAHTLSSASLRYEHPSEDVPDAGLGKKKTSEDPSGRAGTRLPQHKSCCSQQPRVSAPEPSLAAGTPAAGAGAQHASPKRPRVLLLFYAGKKGERERKMGKNHTGVQPEPPACPSVVTVAAPGAAVSPTRNFWQPGFGPAMPLAHHDSEKLPSPEEDSHPPSTSVVQGAAGIVPLDGAIVKELGFVNYISDSRWDLPRGSR